MKRSHIFLAFSMAFVLQASSIQALGFWTSISGWFSKSASTPRKVAHNPQVTALNDFIKRHGVKTVINVRKKSVQGDQWQGLISAWQDTGVVFYDMDMCPCEPFSHEKCKKFLKSITPRLCQPHDFFPLVIYDHSGFDDLSSWPALFLVKPQALEDGTQLIEALLGEYDGYGGFSKSQHLGFMIAEHEGKMHVVYRDREEYYAKLQQGVLCPLLRCLFIKWARMLGKIGLRQNESLSAAELSLNE